MNLKLFFGAIAMALLMGVSVLAGSILVPRASAGAPVTQTGQLAQQAQATPTAGPGNSQPRGPKGPGFGSPGGFDHGRGGPVAKAHKLASACSRRYAGACGPRRAGETSQWREPRDTLVRLRVRGRA